MEYHGLKIMSWGNKILWDFRYRWIWNGLLDCNVPLLRHLWWGAETNNSPIVMINSLIPGRSWRCGCNLKCVIFNPFIWINVLSFSCEIVLRWMPHWWLIDIVSGNCLVPSGNKPLLEPMLAEIAVTMLSLGHNELTQLTWTQCAASCKQYIQMHFL